MSDYKKLFMDYMDKKGIRYINRDTFVVTVPYRGDNLKAIPIYVFFDEDCNPMAQLKCWSIANFKGKEDRGVLVCNELNKVYRWIKFYMDDDGDIVASVDTYIDENTCGFVCLELLRRLVNIIDEAYRTIAKALFAD